MTTTKQSQYFRMTYSSSKSLDMLRDIFSVSPFTSSDEGHYAFDSVHFRFNPNGLTVEATDGRRLIQHKFSTDELFEHELVSDVTEFNISESMGMVQDLKTAGKWSVLFPSTIGRFSIPKATVSVRLTITPESIELDVWNKKNDCKTFKAVARDSGIFPDTDKIISPNGKKPCNATVALSADYLADLGKAFPGQTVYLTVPVDKDSQFQQGTISIVRRSKRAGKSVAILAPIFQSNHYLDEENTEFYRPVMFNNK